MVTFVFKIATDKRKMFDPYKKRKKFILKPNFIEYVKHFSFNLAIAFHQIFVTTTVVWQSSFQFK